MSLRPTTARPKTSAGNRAVSSRGNRRQTTSYQNFGERQQSRAGVPNPTVNEYSVSRVGLISQNSSSNRHPQSKAGAERRNAPPTGSISVALPRTSARPVTKQGLVGVRPTSRAATGLNRQIVDKSYYISLLRSQMNNLLAEIENLRNELEKGERDRQDLIIYEKRAEEEAENLQDLHGRLIDLNVVIDHLHKNIESKELEEEINELKARNDAMEQNANEIFTERKEEEAEVEEIERMIESQKAANEAIQNNMDPRVKCDIEKFRNDLTQITEEYQRKNNELIEVTAKKDALEEEFKNSALKRRALELYEQLAEIEAKKESVLKECSEEASPEELKDQLLQTVVKTSNEINVIENQLSTVNERILQCNEEIREFDMEFENTAAEKSSKYRELKLKEMQYDEFLNNYKSSRAEIEAKIDSNAESVVQYLLKIALNCDNVNMLNDVPEIATNALDLLNNSAASPHDLQQLHIRLQEEILAVKEREDSLKNEVGSYKDQIQKLTANYNELEQLNSNAEQQQNELMNQQKALKEQLTTLKKALYDVDNELSALNTKLNNNVKYQKLKEAEKRLQSLNQRRSHVEAELSKRRSRLDYKPLMEQVMELKDRYNELLLQRLKQ